MKKKYSVTASMPGCLPDNFSEYDTKTAAIWGMKYELENWAEGWKYQYNPEKKEDVKILTGGLLVMHEMVSIKFSLGNIISSTLRCMIFPMTWKTKTKTMI